MHPGENTYCHSCKRDPHPSRRIPNRGERGERRQSVPSAIRRFLACGAKKQALAFQPRNVSGPKETTTLSPTNRLVFALPLILLSSACGEESKPKRIGKHHSPGRPCLESPHSSSKEGKKDEELRVSENVTHGLFLNICCRSPEKTIYLTRKDRTFRIRLFSPQYPMPYS